MAKFDLAQTLRTIPRPEQHQGSLTEQYAELYMLAVHFRLYDAADAMKYVLKVVE